MKKYIFAALGSLICFSPGFSDTENSQPNQTSVLGKVIENSQAVVFNNRHDNEWIIGLEDGSFWKLHALENKRKKTWGEWWKKTDPQEWSLDKDFFFEPNKWKGNFVARVYASEKSVFPECSHILENQITGEKAFAEFIPFKSKYIPSITFADKFFDHPYNSVLKVSSTVIEKTEFLDNLVILDDNSCWKAFPFKENSATWSQWFSGEQADQPDEEFIFELSEWEPHDSIQMYFLQDDTTLYEKYDLTRNMSKFDKKGIFLIENKTKNQLVYAQKTALDEIVNSFSQYAKKQWDQGYGAGHSQGYSSGHSAGYKAGRSEGYTAGYNAGRNAGYNAGRGTGRR